MIRKLLMFLITWILFTGCGSADNPVVPDSQSAEPGPQTLASTSDSQAGARMLWGMWEWIIDLREGTFEAVSLRSADLHYNVAKAIDNPPTKFTFSNFILDKPSHTISLDVSILHPFAGRPNLAGFDVKGILIGPGSAGSYSDPSLIFAGPEDTHLLNPDGITRWWNPVEFPQANSAVASLYKYSDRDSGVPNATGGILYDATLNGYKLFADGLGKNDSVQSADPDNRHVFSSGATNTRHYDIWFPLSNENIWFIRYNYAVDACWKSVPGYVPGQQIDIPDDFPIEANQPEAIGAVPNNVTNTLYYVDSQSKGGTSVLTMRIYDWQGLLGSGNVADQIGQIFIESPSCLDGVIYGVVSDPGPDPKGYAEYDFTIEGDSLTDNGGHIGLLTVVCANGDYQPGLTQYAGQSPLAYYQLFDFPGISTEAPANQNPVAIAQAEHTTICIGTPLKFDATDSYDPDGTIMSYEWDFDGDGVYGDSFDSGTAEEPYYIFNAIGVYEVDLLVTDDDEAVDALDEPLLITVTPPNENPVAIATVEDTGVLVGTTVTFDGSGSYDPDGEIVLYEWDFDGDGLYDAPTGGTPVNPEYIYEEVGLYAVDLQVTDDLGATDTLDNKLYMNVYDESTNIPPTACATVDSSSIWEDDETELDGSCSFDTDGTIISYLWDFNNDGIYGDPISNGTNLMPIIVLPPGEHIIDLKVVDNGGLADTLDEPLEIFVDYHVSITLPEDQYYKSANGYEYWVITGDASVEPVPINYTDIHGPWDFTPISFGPELDYLNILEPTDPEVSFTVPGYYPASTDYFLRYDIHGLGVNGYVYLPEEADYAEDILWIYGHIGYNEDLQVMEPYKYGPEVGGPIGIQFPLDVYMNEDWPLEYWDGNMLLFVIHYSEWGYGEGYCTVPFAGTYTDKALLTISRLDVTFFGSLALQALLYKWTGDDGRQLARLVAFNSEGFSGFDPATNEIDGEWRLSVLKDVF